MRQQTFMKSITRKITSVFMYCLTLIFIAPFYISIVYSFKNKNETALSPLGLPKILHFENYIKAIQVSNFFNALKNSFIVTVFAVNYCFGVVDGGLYHIEK